MNEKKRNKGIKRRIWRKRSIEGQHHVEEEEEERSKYLNLESSREGKVIIFSHVVTVL